MGLNYQSTRDANNVVTASQAILQGLAVDGGLYVPTEMPKLDLNFKELANKTYQEVAYLVLSAFLTDFTEEELMYCINGAYDQKFVDPAIAPLNKVGNVNYLELFHGSTLAFKDIALSILPYFMTVAAKKNKVDAEIVILTATSGDTGKAAMAGFSDVPGTKIIVFYPKDGVSPIQEKQMVTQKGENTFVVGINGNFDDAQTNVKNIFNNTDLKEELRQEGYQFSSANSINIGRLVPQIVYYVYSYAQLIKSGEIKDGDLINFVVPTGNFGNILAGYYAKQIGVPINQLVCASNENNVLTDFFTTGTYDRKRPFHITTSPSMDILISSNLERLIYHIANNEVSETKHRMEQLLADGEYSITAEMNQNLEKFYGEQATEEEVKEIIATVFNENHYLMDTHTGVAAAAYQKYQKATQDSTPTVIVSTASPYKFPQHVMDAFATDTFILESEEAKLVQQLHEFSNLPIPPSVTELFTAAVLHDTVIDAAEMEATVKNILNLKK
ncbi:threonine synthase [Carnobacterium gallinarum]|uniref:threonine synthase n=1 Tax=Carnobacterium gallinarum TaxID=2749 RepID=UPI000557C110|nr:threonine synthase [Carnobacterium gallinarum]